MWIFLFDSNEVIETKSIFIFLNIDKSIFLNQIYYYDNFDNKHVINFNFSHHPYTLRNLNRNKFQCFNMNYVKCDTLDI